MKRLFTLVLCFLSLQIVKASSSFIASANFFEFQSGQLNNSFKANGDTSIVPVINIPSPLPRQSGIYKRRLDSLKKDVPLDYNEYVQSYIELYSRNREEMGRVLGLTKYYFPIYEKAFRDAGIPEEIKYLSIVESKLDPYAISRVGATGPWQFMFTTARFYGLNMDEYVDDRRDPIQASYAAAAYLKDAYQEFGDWLLAIASYNCGKSNVEHAIEKAGVSDFWAIRQYLPYETRGYVPAYIAVTYIMNYYKNQNIIPQACNIALKTDTVLVNKYVALSTVAHVLDIELRELTILNPAYKKQVINGTAKNPRRLVIPQIEKDKFGALYNALNSGNVVADAPRVSYASAPYHESKTRKIPVYHTVQRGEKLGDIAATYDIKMQDLKDWNHLRSNKVSPGQKIRLTEATDAPDERTTSIQHHQNYITYKVKSGDTLSGIAAKFDGASVEKIRSVNGLTKDRLQPGMTIRINKG